MAADGEELDDRLVTVGLLEVEDGVDLALRLFLPGPTALVLGRRGGAPV